jgi:transposase-like protein
MNATHDSLVKFDRRGRLRYAPEQKAALVEAYAASGVSGPKFAALHGVNYQTFASWLQKRKRAGGAPGLPAPQDWSLVEVEAPVAGVSAVGLTVLLAGGTELHVASHAAVPLAAALIRELSRPC